MGLFSWHAVSLPKLLLQLVHHTNTGAHTTSTSCHHKATTATQSHSTVTGALVTTTPTAWLNSQLHKETRVKLRKQPAQKLTLKSRKLKRNLARLEPPLSQTWKKSFQLSSRKSKMLMLLT